MKITLETAEQIREAVDQGRRVNCETIAYEVIKDSIGQYLIKCTMNGSVIGLTHQDNSTLNGSNFYIDGLEPEITREENKVNIHLPEFEIELDGNLVKSPSGDLEFEPSWFKDEKSEEFWDENWEEIKEVAGQLESMEKTKKDSNKELYLEYCNSYLTIEKMAEHLEMDEEILESRIDKGREEALQDHLSKNKTVWINPDK